MGSDAYIVTYETNNGPRTRRASTDFIEGSLGRVLTSMMDRREVSNLAVYTEETGEDVTSDFEVFANHQ